MSNRFGDFFQEKISRCIDSTRNIIESEGLVDPVDYSSVVCSLPTLANFDLLSSDSIESMIGSMSNSTSLLDPIPTKLLKKCLDILVEPITSIVNKSLSEGKFPEKWKMANVTPL